LWARGFGGRHALANRFEWWGECPRQIG